MTRPLGITTQGLPIASNWLGNCMFCDNKVTSEQNLPTAPYRVLGTKVGNKTVCVDCLCSLHDAELWGKHTAELADKIKEMKR